jgi:hypothetical protein
VIPLTGTVSLSNALTTITTQLGSLFSKNAGLDIKAIGTVSISSGWVSKTVPVSFEKTFSI